MDHQGNTNAGDIAVRMAQIFHCSASDFLQLLRVPHRWTRVHPRSLLARRQVTLAGRRNGVSDERHSRCKVATE